MSGAALAAGGSALPFHWQGADAQRLLVQRPTRQMGLQAARLALASLHAELLLYPKPGLVSAVDNGSHRDMTAATFMRSLFALRHYFAAITRAGAACAPFEQLRTLGMDAEGRMLAATGGINTHRGAIFSLGLLCAAYGQLRARGATTSAPALRQALLRCWGTQLAAHAGGGGVSHGLLVKSQHAAGGARAEAALGLPAVFDTGLPALRATLAAGRGMQAARIDALFALMAAVGDTNVLYRGGPAGAALVRSTAQAFVDGGGTAQPQWMAQALAAHRLFVGHGLSPGGAADLLAATCLVQALCD